MGQKIFREQELKEVLSEIQKERDVHQVLLVCGESFRSQKLYETLYSTLKELGIIERIIPEEYPASEENLSEIAEYMKIRMKQFLEKQTGKSGLQIAQERYERFRKM